MRIEYFCKTATFFEQIKECADEPVGKGYLVSCLVDHRGNITEYQCHQYITKMTAIIFSDYRLICGFMDDCKNDINLLKCGSIRLGEKVGTTLALPKGSYELDKWIELYNWQGKNLGLQVALKLKSQTAPRSKASWMHFICLWQNIPKVWRSRATNTC